VFFAFIGFDAVSTAAQEAKNPARDMPIGILGSLVICTFLYVVFSYVLSGMATVADFRGAGAEASVAFAIQKYMTGYTWLANLVTVAILAGFSSVILVMLLGLDGIRYMAFRAVARGAALHAQPQRIAALDQAYEVRGDAERLRVSARDHDGSGGRQREFTRLARKRHRIRHDRRRLRESGEARQRRGGDCDDAAFHN